MYKLRNFFHNRILYVPILQKGCAKKTPEKFNTFIFILSVTPQQFNPLDEMKQAELIWNGKHVADPRDQEHKSSELKCL